MAHPISTASTASCVFMLVSCFSTLCLAVQSDTAPVFPKNLQGALINDSVPLGSVISARSAYQKQRSVQSVNQPVNSARVDDIRLPSQPKKDVANKLSTPSTVAQTNLVPRLAKLPKEQLNQNKRGFKVNSIPKHKQLAEPARDPFQEQENQRMAVESNVAMLAPSGELADKFVGVEAAEGDIAMEADLAAEIDLESEADFGTVMTFPDGDGCSSARIVVHPPESTDDNEFSFIVENVGSANSDAFFVEFETPGDVSILQVFPFNAKTTRNTVVVGFEGLARGSQLPVHIRTTASNQGKFSFQTRIRMEKVHAFEVETSESTLPQITMPPERVPAQLASTGGVVAGTTHRLTDLPDNESAGRRGQVETDSAVNVQQSSIPEVALITSLTGSEVLIEGREYEFEVIVRNQSLELATKIIVQLALPNSLMVTNLDRAAWIDQQQRTVSWKIDSIDAGQSETILYRVKAMSSDEQYQKIVVGMSDTYQGEVDFSSRVIFNEQLKEATQPPFENQH